MKTIISLDNITFKVNDEYPYTEAACSEASSYDLIHLGKILDYLDRSSGPAVLNSSGESEEPSEEDIQKIRNKHKNLELVNSELEKELSNPVFELAYVPYIKFLPFLKRKCIVVSRGVDDISSTSPKPYSIVMFKNAKTRKVYANEVELTNTFIESF